MFKTICKIAWASLFRRRTRSILLILMIAVSLWGLLFMEGIYDGMTEQMITNAIRSDSGHISLLGKGYRLDPDLSKWIRDETQIKAFLTGDTRIQSSVFRLRQDGLVATAHYSRGAALIGITLADEEKHGNLSGYIHQGKFSFGKRDRGAIIGYKLADKLQAHIGSKIILSAQDSQNEVSAQPFKITGILKTNNLPLDESAVFIAEPKMRQLVSMKTGVSQVSIILKNEKTLPNLQKEMRTQFKNIEVLRWDELYPALLQARVLMKGFNLITNILIFCVAALGIFGVMLVSVLERMREFGIMMAIGTPYSQIRNLIFIESFSLGFIGFAIGSLTGFATLLYFKIYGLDLGIFSDGFAAFGMDAVTYAIIRPEYFITALAAVCLATFLSILIPLRVLKKTQPIKAINAV